MVTLLKNSTDYGYYFLESDDGDNDDWITDHAGDPGEADLDTFTLGTEYLYIANYQRTHEVAQFGIKPMNLGGLGTDFSSLGNMTGYFTLNAVCTETYKNYVKSFFNIHKKKTDNYIYMVNVTALDTYEPFYNFSGTAKSYNPFAPLQTEIILQPSTPFGPRLWLCVIQGLLYWIP